MFLRRQRAVFLTGGTLFVALAWLTCSDQVGAAAKDKARWDSKYSSEEYLFGTRPIAFLEQNVDLLPKGTVLDLAMGEGRNGVFLATKGFQVTAPQKSDLGIEVWLDGVVFGTDLELFIRPAGLETPCLVLPRFAGRVALEHVGVEFELLEKLKMHIRSEENTGPASAGSTSSTLTSC